MITNRGASIIMLKFYLTVAVLTFCYALATAQITAVDVSDNYINQASQHSEIEPTHIDIAVLSSSEFVTANQPLTALWALSYFSIPSITDALTVIRAPPKA